MTKGLILSAGFGTRLRPLTDLIPKPLVKVKNKTAIEYVIDMHKKGKVEHIAINLHHKAKEIVDHLGYNYVYSYEPKIQGTAGAIRQLQGWFLFEEDEHFVVSNGDTITNLSLLDMYDFHRKHGKLATVFTHDDLLHNGGTFIFRYEVLSHIPPGFSLIQDLLTRLARDDQYELYESDAYYYDIGTPEKLKQARRFFNANNDSRP